MSAIEQLIDMARQKHDLAAERPVNDRQAISAAYDALLLDHIKNARNNRTPGASGHVLTSSNVLCGDELTLYLVLENERIDDIAYQASCCEICMASASIMTEFVKGRIRVEAAALLRDFIDALARSNDQAGPSWTREQQAILEAARKYPSACAARRSRGPRCAQLRIGAFCARARLVKGTICGLP